MKSILKKVMTHDCLVDQPPVLLDIGASGALPEQWKPIAPYSVCVAFDADTRDFKVEVTESRVWRKLYSLNRLVTEKQVGKTDFYFTQSPYCSSSLKPDQESLKPWAFNELFNIEKIAALPTVHIQAALANINIDYIDWYKTDTQGIDLRIFDSLAEKIKHKVIMAEFEPGIIDAYINEDKLHHLMAYMDKQPFWVSDMKIKGSQRIGKRALNDLPPRAQKHIDAYLKTAPGWCEISYINSLQSTQLTIRELLLAWVFSSIKGEHGYAMSTAELGAQQFQASIFNELHAHSLKVLSSSGKIQIASKAAKRTARLILRRS